MKTLYSDNMTPTLFAQFPVLYKETLNTSSNLVDIMDCNDSIKVCVEVIEQIDHFDGFTEGRDGGETHNITEIQCDFSEMLWLYWLPCF